MNKAELCDKLANKHNLTKKQAEEFLDSFEETVIGELKKGGEVVLTGFGAFTARTRSARMGVNPKNPTERIQIPEVRVVKFKAGKTLKDSLKN